MEDGRRKGLTAKGHERIFSINFYGNILYLDCGDGYMVVYVWQNSLNCTLAMDTFYCIQMVSQES